ncbi:putative ATPase/DNA-binding SARP family transcriptional activator [Kibdelosporangium banguiense]|uniref:ATPase/DNA-binding SARP family transcriptional activator n=1 Tax=Kibdelosporangium banguiense TaxID=1365924 RepID=A0ABS4TKI2_9PSEU|nr:BTAD domain-containing putative transcriptional regulator [Kibdelosporangium banguiense]MBP2324356.1 putative ATPase/DNA-binding SARP family transcriptional activator [Kibdelosporangium banguiense]
MLVVRVLGPVEVTVEGTRVDLGGTLPRRLLTALAVADGQVVPDDRLAELVWGRQQPAKVSAALQVYVSRLRKALGPDGRDVVERDGIGYRLRAELDAAVFTNAVDEYRKLNDPVEIMRGLTEALDLWRGEPYADLDDVDAARTRLKELREVALEERAAARVASGDAAGAVPDLEELVRAAPLRERRWALLILALYRGGRQGDALATVRRARQVLADELGVDPGDELQDLERQVLAHDPRLTVPEPTRSQPGGRPLTSFLGREAELSTIAEQLATQRLVSLIGPAGVGKTRLAVEYVGKAWFARLADVRQSGELPSVVADAVGLIAVQDDPITATIRTIAARSGLLVLDNCEHVVAAAAELAMTLIAGCPQLKILATSREPLGVDGEVTVVIDPLPPASADALLVDRVQAIRPGWHPSPEELADARRISAALDGLPLAIELAAARARMFGLSEIAERLDDRFALLGQVPRGSLAVHATLEAAIGWSVDLLSEEDRALLLRLWPFEGGFSLEAAEHQNGGQALESLSSLVTRSVVVADTTVMPTRYLLLESVRAYCESIDPDPARTRAAHAEWVHELGRRCLVAMRGKRADWYLRVLSRELPNIRAGLKHDLEHAPGEALQTLVRLGLLFTRTVHKIEAATLARDVLAAASDAPAFQRARGMVVLLALTAIGGDRAAAGRLLADAFEVAKDIGDDEDPLDVSELYYHLAFCSVEIADVPNTLLATERAIRIGIPSIARAAETVRAAAYVVQAHVEGDVPAMLDAARVARRLGRGFTAGWSSLVFAEANALAGDAAEALNAVRHALGVFNREQDIPNAIGAFYFAAVAFARTGRPFDAVRLLTAVHEHANRFVARPPTLLVHEIDWVDEALADVLEPAERAVAEAEGLQLTWADMVDLVMTA